jgi:hypothetical protein
MTTALGRALFPIDTAALKAPGVSLDELSQQLGLIDDTAQFLRAGGRLITPTPRTDTARMIEDISRYATFRDSVDTLIQNAYFATRGLRLDRKCIEARYASVDRRIAVLDWLTLALLLVLPVAGLRMSWVWFGSRSKSV